MKQTFEAPHKAHQDNGGVAESFAEMRTVERAIDLKTKIKGRIAEEATTGISLLSEAKELGYSIQLSVERLIADPDFAPMNLALAKDDITERMRAAYRMQIEKRLQASQGNPEAVSYYAELLQVMKGPEGKSH